MFSMWVLPRCYDNVVFVGLRMSHLELYRLENPSCDVPVDCPFGSMMYLSFGDVPLATYNYVKLPEVLLIISVSTLIIHRDISRFITSRFHLHYIPI